MTRVTYIVESRDACGNWTATDGSPYTSAKHAFDAAQAEALATDGVVRVIVRAEHVPASDTGDGVRSRIDQISYVGIDPYAP